MKNKDEMSDQEFANHTGLQIKPLNGSDIIEARRIWEECVVRHYKPLIDTTKMNINCTGKEYLESVKRVYE